MSITITSGRRSWTIAREFAGHAWVARRLDRPRNTLRAESLEQILILIAGELL